MKCQHCGAQVCRSCSGCACKDTRCTCATRFVTEPETALRFFCHVCGDAFALSGEITDEEFMIVCGNCRAKKAGGKK